MNPTLKIQSLFLAILGLAAFARGQGTSITYQGQLNNNGAPVTGAYDLQFSIFDSNGGANVLAGPLSVPGLGVTNGLFTAKLDFGTGLFTGPARWLEIRVRPAGNGNFATLTPRQELTSSPYAIRAQTAGTATDVSNGSVVKSLNNLRDNITLAAGANVTVTPSGNTLTIASAGGGGAGIWSLNGTDAYYNGGKVGIGTMTPMHSLGISAGPSWTANGWQGSIELENASAIAWKANAGGQRFGLGHTTGGFYLFRTTSDPGTTRGAAVYDFVVNDSGNVGIGTVTPAERLSILDFSGGNNSGLKISGFGVDGVGMAIESVGPGGHKWALVSGGVFNPLVPGIAGNFRILDQTANATRLVIAPDGNVGIGEIANPQAKLDVQGTMRTTAITITGGSDLAEPFPISSANVAEGSVMIIDDEHPGKLKLSVQAYDTRVAGIVSGANGVRPGITLSQEGVMEGDQNVALSGRVYVMSDAAQGRIKPGDLLTTSDTPGHAMKVMDPAKAQGAILGKAMSGLKEGKGMVLVLVTLQ